MDIDQCPDVRLWDESLVELLTISAPYYVVGEWVNVDVCSKGSDADDIIKIEYSFIETVLTAMMAVAVFLPVPWVTFICSCN